MYTSVVLSIVRTAVRYPTGIVVPTWTVVRRVVIRTAGLAVVRIEPISVSARGAAADVVSSGGGVVATEGDGKNDDEDDHSSDDSSDGESVGEPEHLARFRDITISCCVLSND